MRSNSDSTRPSAPSHQNPPNAFSPAFLARFRDQDGEALTATEAAHAGPWKVEPLRPGLVAVLREWESLAAGDVPEGVFVHDQHAHGFAALLPLLGREPLFYLDEVPVPEGYPLTATYGEQGPVTVAWLARSEPELAAGLHLVEALQRSPAALAALLASAGGGVIEQVGRILAGDAS